MKKNIVFDVEKKKEIFVNKIEDAEQEAVIAETPKKKGKK